MIPSTRLCGREGGGGRGRGCVCVRGEGKRRGERKVVEEGESVEEHGGWDVSLGVWESGRR